MKKVWKILKYLLAVIIIAAFVTAFISMTVSKAPDEMQKVLWNASLIEAYNKEPEGFRIFYISEFEKNYSSSDGRFYISHVRYSPDARQWQLTVGCNDSTVKDLAGKRGIQLDEKKENFRFAVMDQNGNVYSEYDYVFGRRQRHSFRRVIFEGIPQKGVSSLTLCIYYTGDVKDGTLPDKPLVGIKFYDPVIRLTEWTEDDAKKPPKKKTVFTHCEALPVKSINQSEETTDDN